MGYPMSYGRLINRNLLHGDYSDNRPACTPSLIRGDLRRLEQDQQDEHHIKEYARISGASEEQVRTILRAFFTHGPFCTEDRFPVGKP